MSKRKGGWDLEELLKFGMTLDNRPLGLEGETVGVWLGEALLRIRDRDGVERALSPNAAQRAFEARRGGSDIVLKARQMGMTTWLAGRFFLRTITRPGVMTVQVAHTQEAAEGIFRIAQRFWECLPEELKEGPLRRSKATSGQMRFAELDSEFRVLSAGDGSAGRGLTINFLHCSEVSRWPGDAAAVLAGLRGAVAPGGEVVLESTPNGAYGCFYREWTEAAENGMVQHFFPWWMEAAYVAEAVRDADAAELELMRRSGLTAEQIGFRRELERRYQGMRTQEFAEDPESCFRATGECCFEIEFAEARLARVSEPAETRRDGALQIWLPSVPGRSYVVGVDTAGGGAGGDFAAVQVIDRETGAQCAELRQRLGVLELARAAAMLGREYGGALLAVERNNHGSGVLAYLDSSERYQHVYEQEGVAGWLTTAGNKAGMIDRIGVLLVEEPWIFQSRRLLEECRTFVRYAGGRMGAASGAHDDCLMAMAVAQAVRAEMSGRRAR